MATQKSKRIHAILSLLVLLALALSGCNQTKAPTPTAGESGPTAAGVGQATARPTPGPSPTPAPPTVTPMPLPPPRLLSRLPAPGSEHPLDAPIELTFDQPMDRASVEAAFIISPTIQGTFTWNDDRSLSFAPSGRLERGTRYTVTIAATARNAEGKRLEEPAQFDFSTTGFLAVSQVQPAPDAEDLGPDTLITVVFNRPVVPLTALGEQDRLPDPLTFMPPVRGEGEWLNSAIYVFRPAEGLQPATRYQARVAAGLTDTAGGVLEEDYAWTFTTIRPAALATSPAKGFQYAGPTEVISVTFNQPMDHASVQSRFSLLAGDQAVAGTFRWQGSARPAAHETMIFVPKAPLPRGTTFEARLEEGARARAGDATLMSGEAWTFSTAKEPGIVSTVPSNGSTSVDPNVSVRLTFAGPMDRTAFADHLTITPQVTPVYTYWEEYDNVVQISFQKKPATAYAITLDAGTPDKFGGTLGKAFTLRFTTGDLPPAVVFNADDRLGTYSTYTETVIYATYRNVSRLDLALYRMTPETFMKLNGFGEWDLWEKYAPNKADLIRTWSTAVRPARNQAALARFELTDARGNSLPPGLYYLHLTAPEVQMLPHPQPSRYAFVKSGVNLTLKQTHSEAMVWATDLTTGQPMRGLPITFYQKEGVLATHGSTDADGLYVAEGLSFPDLWSPFFAMSGEPGDAGFGIAFNGWEKGISPWDFGIESEYWSSRYEGYLYTDRPIYRPGQIVRFKGILRADDDANYSLPKEVPALQVLVNDPQGKELFRKKLSLSPMGTFYDQLALDQEAPLGFYYIEFQDPEREIYKSASFQVAEYRAPEYQVSVKPDRTAVLPGDRIAVHAEATYYFGGPVAGAAVHWSVLSANHFFSYQCPQGQSCPWYDWSDYEWGSYEDEQVYGGYGRLIAEGDTVLDAQGRVTFRVPADISDRKQSQLFTIEASVTDLNGQQVSNHTAAVVHKGEFYVGVAARGTLAEVGEPKPVDLLTVDWDGQPVANVPLTVTFMEHNWYSVRRLAEDGNYYWDWTSHDVPVYTTTVITGVDGKAVAAFAPQKPGSYKVRAVGRDSRENEIRSSTYFWVWGGDEFVSWRQESNNRITLIADKKEYQVGDRAEILIPSPYTGTVQALVTVERGHVLRTEVVELTSNSEVLRVPITEEHVPNVFVSVVIVQGADQAPDGLASFKMGVVKLPVALDKKRLRITLTPDKDMAKGEHYGPRQNATYDVLVTNDQGAPVQAELSLRLADLSVLALADEQGPTLMDTFWRSRGLGVKTSLGLVVAMEPFNREIVPRLKGGGGGEEGGLVRTRFADTAFWEPALQTGRDGKARVTVPLPDNLTTWRMQARGITASTQVGQADVDVLSTLDLLVRPILPRFFVAGDKAQIGTVVHNNTGNDLDVQVNISAEGLAVDGATGQTVRVAAGDKGEVRWPVTALMGTEVRVRTWASAGGLYDGREDVLPVYRYSTPEVTATAGRLSEAGVRQEIVQLPSVLDPTQGELTIQLDGSLTAATQEALTYLEHFPYECVEQTVSRFLPNVLTYRVLDEMGLERPELRQKLSQMVGVALQRLYAEQHYDGGWGWWVADESNPYLTAYVLQGMIEAQTAGFVVDGDAMGRAAGYLRDNLPSVGQVDNHWKANRLAYQIYALAEYDKLTARGAGGQGRLGLAVRLYDKRHLLDRYGRAFLAVALSLLEPEEPQRVRVLLSDLAGEAVMSAAGTHWEEDRPDTWNMNTDIRSTAIVLWALSRLDPKSELLPNTVRWLMSARKEGHWSSTHDTSWSLLSLMEYMRATGEMQGDFSYAVYLNGENIAAGDVSKDTLSESRRLQIEIARLLVDEGNRLVIERRAPAGGQTGAGQLYYAASLRTYLPAERVQALDRGIVVARQYSLVDDPVTYVTGAQVGDVIQVKLTVIAPTDLYYVVVEDPLPAGCEGVDLSLKTTSVVGKPPEVRNLTAEGEDRWLRGNGWGWWWFSHSEMRDEKVALFSSYLPRGTYEYTYLMRASVPGQFLVMPATAYQMYFPEVFGRSDGGRFTVEPGE